MLKSLPIVALTAALACSTGCGDLLDASILFDTGEQSLTLDTAALGIKIPGSKAAIPKVPCTKDSTCNAVPGLKCGGSSFECGLKCINKTCAIVASAEQSTRVDLSQQIKNQKLAGGISKVTFEYMLYSAPHNSFNFDTPQIQLFIGPDAAKSTKENGVVLFSTMPSIKRKNTPSNEKMSVTETGKASLQGAIINYKAPFRFFGKAALTFKQGDQIPTGKLILKIRGYFKVDPF